MKFYFLINYLPKSTSCVIFLAIIGTIGKSLKVSNKALSKYFILGRSSTLTERIEPP